MTGPIQTRRQHLALLGAGSFVLCSRRALAGEVVEVRMLNRDPEDGKRQMVFAPDLIRVPPGTTLRFLPTDRGHNTASTDGMLPEGAEPWRSRINDPFDLTLEIEGTYGFHCTPHLSMGMVGLVLVGDATVNFDAARAVRQRGRAAERYEDLFARAEALLAEDSA